MSDIINLRTARKRLERSNKSEIAAQNRVAFGTPKALLKSAKSNKSLDDKKLDQHRLDRDKNGDE